MKNKNTAIVLAAGKGTRMQSDIPKQYLELAGYPVLYYTLKAFEDSFIDEIILVTGPGEQEYCKQQIVDRYHLQKVTQIVSGGKERYHSVYAGLKAIPDTDYVYIHDGARPFVDGEILQRIQQQLEVTKACVAAMPVKDTIKIVDEEQFVKDTPERKYVWQIQTPQAFSFPLVLEAYEKLMQQEVIGVTDDAMVVERMLHHPIKLVEGSYKNIKITTPEDLQVGEAFLK